MLDYPVRFRSDAYDSIEATLRSFIWKVPVDFRCSAPRGGSELSDDITPPDYLQLPPIDPRIKALAEDDHARLNERYDKQRNIERDLKTKLSYTLYLLRLRRTIRLPIPC